MADRYQSADAVLSDLHRLTDRKPLGSRGALWIAAASIGLVGLVGLITLRSRTHSDLATGVARFSNPVQLTSSLGVEDFPDWSPDGKSVVYQASQSGSSDIWVLTFSTRKPINRTPEYRGQDRFPSFSPDGRRIAFWSDREGEGFFVMDAFSGPARKVVSAERLGPAHWSADGTRLTYGAFDGKEAGFETVSLVDGETWRRGGRGTKNSSRTCTRRTTTAPSIPLFCFGRGTGTSSRLPTDRRVSSTTRFLRTAGSCSSCPIEADLRTCGSSRYAPTVSPPESRGG